MAFIENLGKTIFADLFSSYFFGGIATVVGISMLSKTLKGSAKPYVVGITKEVFSFQQWLNSSLAESKEFWEDVSAEAQHQCKSEIDKKLQILQKQQEILQKIKTNMKGQLV